MKKLALTFASILIGFSLQAHINARLMRYPDVSETHITFVYGDDVWIVSKSGGTAVKLSSPAGEEMFPRFSPDGKHIAYTANYDGNSDVYVIESMGGIPKRLTYHGMFDRTLDWTPDGSKVLFASSRESGRQRYNQFYTVSYQGGMTSGSFSQITKFVDFDIHFPAIGPSDLVFQAGDQLYLLDLSNDQCDVRNITECRDQWCG